LADRRTYPGFCRPDDATGIVALVTDVVVIANVAVLAPPATVTPAGTTAAALLLARVTLLGTTETEEGFAADAGTAAKTAARTTPRSPGLEARFMGLVPIPVVPESDRN
jgi:hypothetical protein